MRAIVRDDRGVTLAQVPVPTGEVVIDVAFAGVCRSDLAVADGTIAVPRGRVLGHELAGRVRSAVAGFAVGDPVTVIPFVACTRCPACGRGERCLDPAWLGIARDGAFADQLAVPARNVLALPASMSLVLGAYVEPVAAALGVLAPIAEPGLPRRGSTPGWECGPIARAGGPAVVVSGTGRIAELTARVVAAHGASVVRHVPGEPLPPAAFDVAIEHGGELAPLVASVRPGGTLVLKSRAHRPLALDAGELVARDLTIRGASHGSFVAAIDWLVSRRIVVDDLLAPPRPLEELAAVFEDARASEAHKQLFAIAPADGTERGR
jgi:L-iditol 2-dehydrogenase